MAEMWQRPSCICMFWMFHLPHGDWGMGISLEFPLEISMECETEAEQFLEFQVVKLWPKFPVPTLDAETVLDVECLFESWSCYSWPHPRVCLCHTETPLIGWHVLTSLHYLSSLFIKAYPSPLFNAVKKSVFRERGTSPTPGSCRVFFVSPPRCFLFNVCVPHLSWVFVLSPVGPCCVWTVHKGACCTHWQCKYGALLWGFRWVGWGLRRRSSFISTLRVFKYTICKFSHDCFQS